MRKTKREFLRVFREKFNDQANFSPGAAAELAAVIAAESVGVTWDPEEKPLPERITWRRYASPLLFPVDGPGIFVSPQEEDACYNEAVRRYNAFPRVAALFARLYAPGTSPRENGEIRDKIKHILDGREAP